MNSAKQYKILVLDDEREIVEYYRQMLECCGYAVSTATDSNEALKMLRENYYDVIIQDLRRAGIAGVEFLVELKKLGKKPAVIIVSASLNDKLERDLLQAGCFACRRKPFESRMLCELVAEAIEV